MKGIIGFPNPVNEVAARFVAGGVVLMSLGAIVFDLEWLTLVIAYGFIARVLTGPKLSPLGLLVTRVVVPLSGIPEKLTPGPPKRFAQALGAAMSVTAAVLWVGFDAAAAAQVVLGVLVFAATLESVFGICLGCITFKQLMRTGVIPQAVCESCADIWARPRVSN